MNAVEAAAEAATNGAEPVAKASVNVGTRIINISGNIGAGFFGIALSGVGVSIAAQSFKAALAAAKA